MLSELWTSKVFLYSQLHVGKYCENTFFFKKDDALRRERHLMYLITKVNVALDHENTMLMPCVSHFMSTQYQPLWQTSETPPHRPLGFTAKQADVVSTYGTQSSLASFIWKDFGSHVHTCSFLVPPETHTGTEQQHYLPAMQHLGFPRLAKCTTNSKCNPSKEKLRIVGVYRFIDMQQSLQACLCKVTQISVQVYAIPCLIPSTFCEVLFSTGFQTRYVQGAHRVNSQEILMSLQEPPTSSYHQLQIGKAKNYSIQRLDSYATVSWSKVQRHHQLWNTVSLSNMKNVSMKF